MKTLINKANPQIRITAPEIKVNIDTQTFYIGEEMFDMEDWTLVGEKENISFANRLKERLENMTQEEFEKAMNEMYVEGDESPTLEEYLKAAYHSPIEEEPEKINFYQIVHQSYEDKVKMYMTTPKEELAEMMARRDCIEDALQQQRMFDISQEPVDLEKAADDYVMQTASGTAEEMETLIDAFKAGAKWMAEQIKGGSK